VSETISLDWIGAQLRTIQAEQRTLRGENKQLRAQMSEVLSVVVDRIANFEALAEARLDQLAGRLDHLEGTTARLGAQLIGMAAQLDRIERRP
jgi:hypothetical protein